MLIVILGPDGSGKTTIANELVSFFQEKEIHSHHVAMNFEVLPKLREIINPFLKIKVTVTHIEGEFYGGMKNAPSSTLKGMVLVTWYALDYCLGRFRLRKWNKKGDAAIFARYYFDYYFQRGHLNTPHWYIKLMEVLVPTPDYIFTIKRSADDIFRMKPELSVAEIIRQQEAIDGLLSNRNNAYVIDGSAGIEDTVMQITRIIGNTN